MRVSVRPEADLRGAAPLSFSRMENITIAAATPEDKQHFDVEPVEKHKASQPTEQPAIPVPGVESDVLLLGILADEAVVVVAQLAAQLAGAEFFGVVAVMVMFSIREKGNGAAPRRSASARNLPSEMPARLSPVD